MNRYLVDTNILIYYFNGEPSVQSISEEILQQEITEKSGWTWK